jgi:hypothetical protein
MKRIIIGLEIIFTFPVAYLLFNFGNPIIGYYEHWESFEKGLIVKYPFIDKVLIGGAGPTAAINIKLIKKVDSNQIESIFYYIVNQPTEVFENIREMHEQNHGDLGDLQIDIYADVNDEETIYSFDSGSGIEEELGFSKYKEWTLEHCDSLKKYTIP